MKYLSILSLTFVIACGPGENPDPKPDTGGPDVGHDQPDGGVVDVGRDAGQADLSESTDASNGEDASEEFDVSFPTDVPDAITSAGARFAGRLEAGSSVKLDLTVFQGDRVTMWLRQSNGTQWDASIDVIDPEDGESLVWGNPQGSGDAHIPFAEDELDAGYEFWFTGTYTLKLENRGDSSGDFEFTLECRGGPCAVASGDSDLDGVADEEDDCPYYPGECGTVAYDESEDALESALRGDHVGHVAMDYREARVHMYGWIDNEDGEVECLYTGERVATTEIPDANVMNTEHTWPRGRSGGDPATESDLHHIFPTRSNANTQRASLHFGDVVNASWEEGGSRKGSDASGDTRFEARDERKGDVARALFYYAVMYEMDIPSYEEGVLRAWHEQDPVDDRERRRNQAIANVQGSRNPFIDFPVLVDRISDL